MKFKSLEFFWSKYKMRVPHLLACCFVMWHFDMFPSKHIPSFPVILGFNFLHFVIHACYPKREPFTQIFPLFGCALSAGSILQRVDMILFFTVFLLSSTQLLMTMTVQWTTGTVKLETNLHPSTTLPKQIPQCISIPWCAGFNIKHCQRSLTLCIAMS